MDNFSLVFFSVENRRKNCQSSSPSAESRVEAKLDNATDQIIITKNSASRKPRFPSKGKGPHIGRFCSRK